jgi:Tfp pilus assembly protein PilO
MNRSSRQWKKWVQIALGVILLADLALAVIVIRAGAQPAALREERDRLAREFRRMSEDVLKAEAIRSRLPEIARQCDAFFAEEFLDARTGYSAVIADFTRIAQRAGLAVQRIGFRQSEVEARSLTEVSIEAIVEGDYSALVRFINGLERSEHFYLMNSLALASSAAGRIKLTLELKTYFRNGLPESAAGG